MSLPYDPARVEIKLGEYGTAPATALVDPSLLPKVQEYRRIAGGRMQPLDRDGMMQKIPAAEYHVSRKVDGEFTVLIYRDGVAFTLNPGGTVRVGLPFLTEAAKRLQDAGVREAMIAGELFAERGGAGRPRVHDVVMVARKPEAAGDLKKLRFAAFDLISVNNAPTTGPFAPQWKQLQTWFGDGELIRTVDAKAAKDSGEIKKLYQAWVEVEGAEGLVVRSDEAGSFKIKPRHTLDCAVIGFAESAADRQGMLHDMLLGIKRQDGTLQMLGRVGGGFSDDQRRTMLSDLKDMIVDSEYAEVNSDHVAYQMVQPEWVVEVSCLDLLAETTRGGPINRMVLDYRETGKSGYQVVTKLPLATIISPQFVRKRDDKRVRAEDCGIRQVAGIVEVPLLDRDARQMTLPVGEVLRREVYVKEQKGQMMVRKFLMWKTNKETVSDEYPGYVVHFTDFSPNRKDPLAREIRVTNSAGQLERFWEELKTENVKAGWNKQDPAPISAPIAAAVPAEQAVAPPSPARIEAIDDAPPKPPRKTAAPKAAPVELSPETAAPEITSPEPEAAPSERVKKPRKKKSG